MATILEQARDKLIHLCREEDVDVTQPVIVSPLSPDEAIGPNADDSFVIRKGKETVVEATFCGARGQAFTDSPSAWDGALSALLGLDLSVTHHRAVFVAALNAVVRFLDELSARDPGAKQEWRLVVAETIDRHVLRSDPSKNERSKPRKEK